MCIIHYCILIVNNNERLRNDRVGNTLIPFIDLVPQGLYRLNFKGISRCPFPTNKLIQLNYYLSKKSATETEIKGNATTLIPVDDSLDVSTT